MTTEKSFVASGTAFQQFRKLNSLLQTSPEENSLTFKGGYLIKNIKRVKDFEISYGRQGNHDNTFGSWEIIEQNCVDVVSNTTPRIARQLTPDAYEELHFEEKQFFCIRGKTNFHGKHYFHGKH